MSNPLWPMLAAERSTFADYLPSLSAEDWNRDTPCAGWTVKDQVAHIVAGAQTTPLTFGPSLLISGFSFDKLSARGIRQRAGQSRTELIDALKDRVNAKTVPGAAYLGEILVHSEDVREAVGAGPAERPEAHLRAVADYYKGTGGPVNGKKRIAGLRMTATDSDWTTGSGPEVQGPLVTLIMAMCGRDFAVAQLTGAGTTELANRMQVTG
jgi:uncharacterized protein (TIGR03083 family)